MLLSFLQPAPSRGGMKLITGLHFVHIFLIAHFGTKLFIIIYLLISFRIWIPQGQLYILFISIAPVPLTALSLLKQVLSDSWNELKGSIDLGSYKSLLNPNILFFPVTKATWHHDIIFCPLTSLLMSIHWCLIHRSFWPPSRLHWNVSPLMTSLSPWATWSRGSSFHHITLLTESTDHVDLPLTSQPFEVHVIWLMNQSLFKCLLTISGFIHMNHSFIHSFSKVYWVFNMHQVQRVKDGWLTSKEHGL